MKAFLDLDNDRIKIVFTYNPDIIAMVKSINGRKYNNIEKNWNCPVTKSNIHYLANNGFEIEKPLKDILNIKEKNINWSDISDIPELFPYQKEGIQFIESHNGRCLIADEMGLGKTAQALGWLQLHPELRPVVIVVPASLKLNWEKEIKKWMKKKCSVDIAMGKKPYPFTADISIINYDILEDWRQEIAKRSFKVLVMDEAHYIKNTKAQRTKAMKIIGKSIKHVIALTGTPVINRPIEIYNTIKMLIPNDCPNIWAFGREYCDLKNSRFGWDWNGASNTDKLHKWLSDTIMIRRRKAEVLKELPDKLYSFVPMELSNRRNYEFAERDFISWLRDNRGINSAKKAKNAEAVVKMETLKQVAVNEKMDSVIDWVQDHLEVNGKLVVFTTHKSTIALLWDKFSDKAVKLDGSTPASDRQLVVDKFQNENNIRLFIGNIKAAGVGITLTAASSVAFIELGWESGTHLQAEDRCHRIGQKDSVNIYYLLAKNTIEEKIMGLITSKSHIVNAITDGIDINESNSFQELMENMLL